MIKLENIGKKFDDQLVFKYVALEAKPGDFIGIVGRTGCGKSTLLNIISGYEKYDVGSNKVNGVELSKMTNSEVNHFRNKQVAFLFQSFNLIEDLSVYENLKLSVNLSLFKSKKIDQYLEKVGMLEYKHKKVKNLSGGQKQRIALLRAVIKDFDILICDEPTGNLDDTNAKNIMNLIQELCKDKVVIMVTHKKSIANQYFNVVYDYNEEAKTFDLVKCREGKFQENKRKKKPTLISLLGSLVHSLKRMFILKVYNVALVVILAFFILSFATAQILSGGEYEQMILNSESLHKPMQEISGYTDFEERVDELIDSKYIDYIGGKYLVHGSVKLYEEPYQYDTTRNLSSSKITFNENGVEKVRVMSPTSMGNTEARFIRPDYGAYTLQTIDVETFPHKELIVGRMPENDNEIIVDVATLLDLVGSFEISYSEYMSGNVPLDKIEFLMNNRHLEFYNVQFVDFDYEGGYVEQYVKVLRLDIVGFLDSRLISDYVEGMYLSEDVLERITEFAHVDRNKDVVVYKADMSEETHDAVINLVEKELELDREFLSAVEDSYLSVRTLVDFNYFLSSLSLLIFLAGLLTLIIYTFSYYKFDIALYRTLGYNSFSIVMVLSFNNLLITAIGYLFANWLNVTYIAKWLSFDERMSTLSSNYINQGAILSVVIILAINVLYARKYKDRSINSIL